MYAMYMLDADLTCCRSESTPQVHPGAWQASCLCPRLPGQLSPALGSPPWPPLPSACTPLGLLTFDFVSGEISRCFSAFQTSNSVLR